MPALCFYFQVHQPYRLRRFSYFERSRFEDYFDNELNAEVSAKVAKSCYLPTNETILRLIDRHQGRFKVSYALTGVFLEQMERHAPEVIESFRALARTGCVEFIGETYYHSLSVLYDVEEFYAQVEQQAQIVQSLFGLRPQVFRNTELIYDNRIGEILAALRYKAVLVEGVDSILGARSPNFTYSAPGSHLKLLLKNYRLSDDIAFRFSNKLLPDYPLTPEKYAFRLHSISDQAQVVNLFMDYETFGEHQWADTGIFDFLWQLPDVVLSDPRWSILTPSEVADSFPSQGPLSYYKTTSWADKDRDLSAWQGNRMQQASLDTIYEVSQDVRSLGQPHFLEIWRKLQTSDHFYYMSTKMAEDGAVHAYFSPYDSPYDAFVTYANVIKDFKQSLKEAGKPTRSRHEERHFRQNVEVSAEAQSAGAILHRGKGQNSSGAR